MNKLLKGGLLAVMAFGALSATAGDTGALKPISITPADGGFVAPSGTITVKYAEEVAVINWELKAPWYDASGNVVFDSFAYVDTWTDAKALTFTAPGLYDDITLGETYRVEVPEGFVESVATGAKSEAMTLYFTVDYNDIAITVMASGEVEYINNPLSIFINPENSAELDSSKKVTLKAGGKTYEGNVGVGDWGWGYNITFAELPSPITEPGEYELTIPAGVFTIPAGVISEKALSNELTVRNYTIKEPTFMADPTVTPASGSAVEYGTKVVLAYDVTYVYNNWEVARLYNKTQGTMNETGIGNGDNENEVWFRFNPENANDGDLIECVVPQRAVSGPDGDISAALTINYTFKTAGTPAEALVPTSVYPEDGSTVDVSDGATGFSTLNISFSEEDGAVTVSSNATEKIVLQNVNTGVSYNPSEVFFFEAFSQVIINFDNAPTAAGEYTLTIPAGVFTAANGAKNETLVYHYTVAGEVADYLAVVNTTPKDGAEVEALDSFKIYFNSDVTVAEGATANVQTPMTGIITGLTVDPNNSKCVVVEFDEPMTGVGEYTINIEAGVITSGDLSNEMLTFKVNVVADATIKLVSITPSNDEPLASIPEGMTFTVDITRAAEVGFIQGNWTVPEGCADDGIADCVLRMRKNDDGKFTWTNEAWDFKLYEGFTYPLTLTCYDIEPYSSAETATLLGTIVVQYQGATTGAVTLNTTAFESVTPACGSLLSAENNTVTFKFTEAVDYVSSYVSVGGQGAVFNKEIVAESNMLKDEWTLAIPSSWLANKAGSFGLYAFFQDEYGNPVVLSEDKKVAGELGMDDAYGINYGSDKKEVGIMVMYMVLDGGVEINITPAAGKVDKLYSFTVTNPDAASLNEIRWSYNVSPNAIELYNEKNERVAMGASDGVTEAEDNKAVTFLLDKEIVANGTYTLIVPWNAFSLGSEFNAATAKELRVEYVIEGNEIVYDLKPVSVEPAASSDEVLTELKSVRFEFDTEIVLNETKKEGLLTTRTGMESYTGTYSVAEDGKTLVFTLAETVASEEETMYILTLGEGTVATKDGKRGNEELTYDWKVCKDSGVAFLFGENGVADVYSVNGVCVKRNANDLRGLNKGIYVINGKKVVVK